MKDTHDLGLMLDSRVPLIVIETYDEKRATDTIIKVAKKRKRNIFRWSATDGLHRLNFGLQVASAAEHTKPKEILEYIKESLNPAVFVLCDFHPYLENEPLNVRLLKDIAQRHSSVPNTLVFLSHELKVPTELSRYSAVVKMSLPSDEEIMAIVREEAKLWSEANANKRVQTDAETIQKLVANLRGMSHAEVHRLARGAIVDDGAISDEDIPGLNKAKFELMEMDGVLSFEYDTERFSNVGGLSRLKSWLEERREPFLSSKSAGSDLPKGIMLTGIQGSGKSLAAKCIAGVWGLPLLRLDFGALYNKFFGETERNLREALKLAEVMSPCVLWLDEIEKGVSQDQNDTGTSQRVLGTLLTWMMERKGRVFMVATSNDITRLPPELVRKGRLDEIFFVDLPSVEVRRDIFAIHLAKRDLTMTEEELISLAESSDGFSGAEIEQAIVAAIYTSAAQDHTLNCSLVLAEIRNTSPLSVVMAEKISGLRQWASDRTVSAD